MTAGAANDVIAYMVSILGIVCDEGEAIIFYLRI